MVNIKTRHRSRIKIAFREHENSHDSKSIYKNINEKKHLKPDLTVVLLGPYSNAKRGLIITHVGFSCLHVNRHVFH